MLNIDHLERVIGCKLPASVVSEVLNRNSPLYGERDAYRFTFITINEHKELKEFIEMKANSPLSQLPELKLLLADGESNFMGMFFSGPMFGRLALVGHDTNIDCAPLYRSLNSFNEATKAGFKTLDTEWPYQVDYPNTGDELQANSSRADIEGDMACVEQIETLAATESDLFRKRFLNSCVASLAAKECVARLVPMLESSDYHVCGRACSVLGYYQFDEACSKMEKIAVNETNLARFCAVDGLGLMKTKKSREVLMRLIRNGTQLPGNITSALKKNGFEVFFSKRRVETGKIVNDWHVCFSNGDQPEIVNVDNKDRPVFWWKI